MNDLLSTKIINLLNLIKIYFYQDFYELKTSQDEIIIKLNEIFLDTKSGYDPKLYVAFFPNIKQELDDDIEAVLLGDPAVLSKQEVVLCYPGFFAVLVYRLAHALYPYDHLTARLMSEVAHQKTGIDIHPASIIGKSFFIDHGTGVVIGETTKIGNNVRLYQGVTLGAKMDKKIAELRNKKRHPTILDNVIIYANATILGGDTVIGNNVIIGSNVYLTTSVSDNKIVKLVNQNYQILPHIAKHKKEYSLIRPTPLIKLTKFSQDANIFVKMESLNPTGSVKDRTAYAMITEAEINQNLTKDKIIIAATSGNLGIALASLCAKKDYNLIIVMPSNMSNERKKIIKAYGAKLILTNPQNGMKESVKVVKKLQTRMPNSIVLDQFNNLANIMIHETTTSIEIDEALDGKIDIFIAGVGSGGTIMGVGRYLKAKHPSVKIIAVEPLASSVLSGNKPGLHHIDGIGAGFIPPLYDQKIVDEIIQISDEEALIGTKLLAKKEGILGGLSSGASLVAALKVAKKNKNQNIVILIADRGERYLSKITI